MCQFFSFCGDGKGNYLYLDWLYRKNHLTENNDSHTYILGAHKIKDEYHDRYSKYEYNPLLKTFTVDQGVEGHDHALAEAWANKLDFKRIVEPLVIKTIVNPLSKKRKPTKKDIGALKQWASVWASVRASVGGSVWDSVRASVWDSVWASVWDSVGTSVWASVRASVWDSVGTSVWASVWGSVWASVRDSVRDSVGASVWDSVRASVWVYVSSFFDIEYKYDFASCIYLWNRGFVPSFDGKTWRLHSGKKAEVVYTGSIEDIAHTDKMRGRNI